jgi:uncharacterized protein YcbK (DUF882 family)
MYFLTFSLLLAGSFNFQSKLVSTEHALDCLYPLHAESRQVSKEKTEFEKIEKPYLFAARKHESSRKKRVIKGSYKQRKKGVRIVKTRSRKIKPGDLNNAAKNKIKYRKKAKSSKKHQKKRSATRKQKKRKPKKRQVRRQHKTPKMPVYHIHTRDYMKLRVYDRKGRVKKRAIQRFNKITYCYRTGKQLKMNPLLLVELYQAWLYFGMPQVTLFSGCRQPPYSTSTSRHVNGDAIDFNLDGIERKELVKYFLKRKEKLENYSFGVGFYPNSYHIHLDIRKKNGFWVDLSGPGGKRKFVSKPYQYFYRKVFYARSKNKNRVISQN